MLAPMKKPHTEVQITFGQKSFHYSNVPQSKLKPILTLLENYQNDSVPWRDLFKDRFEAAGGESAYMIKTNRKAAGLTQNELADRLKIPQGNLSQMESGKRAVGKAMAQKLGKIFGLDYRVFL
jgi:ribosome-binding protein aMBF1 (putative translation factor)